MNARTSHCAGTSILRDCAHLINEGAFKLAQAGVENPRFEAEIMLADACHCSRAAIICGAVQVDDGARRKYAAMVAQRVRREPLAYVVGRKEFYSLELSIGPAVLIPRPETETVVSAALDFIQLHPQARVCDLGTGSGAIALAIAANAPAVDIIGTDISPEALLIARRNADRLELARRVKFRVADCFEPVDGMGALGLFDLIVSNPPYIREDEVASLAPEISQYEPRIALAGGNDGLDFYRRIAAGLTNHLENGGSLIVEIGADQSDAVTAMMRHQGANEIRITHDLAGLPRVVFCQFRMSSRGADLDRQGRLSH